jgi:hypothetical protein
MALPYETIYKQLQNAFEPYRLNHLQILRQIEASAIVSSQYKEIIAANQRIADLFRKTRVESQWITDIKNVHTSWLHGMVTAAQIQASAKLSLADVARQLSISERLFVKIDFDSLKKTYALGSKLVAQMHEAISNLSVNYERLTRPLQSLSDFVNLPKIVLPGAAKELLTTGYAITELQPRSREIEEQQEESESLAVEISEEVSEVKSLLVKKYPLLGDLLQGAYDAFNSSNIDKARHVLSSLRELWNHLLRSLAPADVVLAWVPEKSDDYLCRGRPTRKARVLYICRHINYDPLSDFLLQDVGAFLKMLEFFNRVHELALGLSDQQLKALLLRTESYISFILRLEEGSP